MGYHIKPLLWRTHWDINCPSEQGLCMGTNIEGGDKSVMYADSGVELTRIGDPRADVLMILEQDFGDVTKCRYVPGN